MQDLRIAIVQSGLVWENVSANLKRFEDWLEKENPQTDLILLPEMFSTGFSMNSQSCAETMDGSAMKWMARQAKHFQCAIAGSLLISESDKFVNRFIWMLPDGNFQHYDKAHLFRYAGEHLKFTEGNKKIIIHYKGWKISPLICYDLRFPVWSRNRWSEETGFDYDLLIYVANWPERRSFAWKSLLTARAIENQCFVAAVNRCGEDGNDISHSGDSVILNPLGQPISSLQAHEERIETIHIPFSFLSEQRAQFQVWRDWDDFQL